MSDCVINPNMDKNFDVFSKECKEKSIQMVQIIYSFYAFSFNWTSTVLLEYATPGPFLWCFIDLNICSKDDRKRSNLFQTEYRISFSILKSMQDWYVSKSAHYTVAKDNYHKPLYIFSKSPKYRN